MQVIINNQDITEHINESSYSVNSVDEFFEWQDANFAIHKIPKKSRVKGSFDIVLGEYKDYSLSDFSEDVSAATTNGLTTCLLWVLNKGETKAIQCYLTSKAKSHRKLSDGTYLDIVTIEVEEK